MNLFNKFDVLDITRFLRLPQGALKIGTKGSEAAVNATAAEINMGCDISANTEVVITTNAITAAESGTTYFLDLVGGFVSTLPAPAIGLRYTFIVKTAPTTAYTVVTTSSANIIKGFATNAAGALVTPLGDGDTITFVANQAVAGDRVDVISDGTSWFMEGFAQVAAGITNTKAS